MAKGLRDGVKVAVTGGTGFIGGYLVEELRSRGHDVVCLARPSSRLQALEALGVQTVAGDLDDANALALLVAGCQVVFHLAALSDEGRYPEQAFWQANVEGTRNLLLASIEAGVELFVFCSTVDVLGPTPANGLDERAPYQPETKYARTKAEAEKLVKALCAPTKTRYCILRPSIVCGPRDSSNRKNIFKALSRGGFVVFGNGKNKFDLVDVRDLVRGMASVPGNRAACNQTFILSGQEKPALRSYLQAIAVALGKKARLLFLPVFVAYLLAYPMSFIARLLPGFPRMGVNTVRYFTTPHVYSSSKAERLLGYKPVIPFQQALNDTVRWDMERDLL